LLTTARRAPSRRKGRGRREIDHARRMPRPSPASPVSGSTRRRAGDSCGRRGRPSGRPLPNYDRPRRRNASAAEERPEKSRHLRTGRATRSPAFGRKASRAPSSLDQHPPVPRVGLPDREAVGADCEDMGRVRRGHSLVWSRLGNARVIRQSSIRPARPTRCKGAAGGPPAAREAYCTGRATERRRHLSTTTSRSSPESRCSCSRTTVAFQARGTAGRHSSAWQVATAHVPGRRTDRALAPGRATR